MIAAGLIALGLALLVAGGELLVRGAARLAALARVPPVVVGLTVVAMGTSMPELVVSVNAALAGSPDLAVGNVVGSNIFNVGLILGIAALIHPLRIMGNTVRLEWPVMLLASLQLYLLARDGSVDRLEGGFLALGLVAFVGYTVWIARRNAAPAEAEQFETAAAARGAAAVHHGPRAWSASAMQVAGGAALLAGGASSLVRGASAIAREAGVSEAVIGLTIVAAGTSLPELVTSAVASFRRQDDIAVANVIGSNVFNILGILGVTAMLSPLPVAGEILARDSLWMIAFAVVLFPLMRSGMRVTRLEGAVLLIAFGVYLAMLLT